MRKNKTSPSLPLSRGGTEQNKRIQAFTIIETLVTLLAITIMIAGPLTFMYKSYHYSEFIKSRIISTGLSQEGLELATAWRNYSLSDFKTMADSCAGNPGAPDGCMLDWDGVAAVPTFAVCSGENCKLYKSSTDATQMYRASGDTDTDQRRYVKFTPIANSNGYVVESKAWSTLESAEISVDLKKMIFNITTK